MAAEFGYNIAFKVNNKTFAGRTQDDLTITPTVKESITKDDAGQKNSAVTGKEVTFSCQGLVVLTDTATTKLVRDDIVELALETGSSAVIPFKYQASSGKVLSGNCIITGYSESSNSEDEATYSVDLKSTGAITFATGS
jgi:predicted secreted protein